MPRQLAAVVAALSIAATCQVDAQRSTEAVRDVIMRCQDCGTIESIREVQEARSPSTPGTASASPIGLVMYIPLGRTTEADKSYVGSVGTREWQARTNNTRYEFTVRMDDGNYRMVARQGVSDLGIGDRVKVTQSQIERWTQ